MKKLIYEFRPDRILSLIIKICNNCLCINGKKNLLVCFVDKGDVKMKITTNYISHFLSNRNRLIIQRMMKKQTVKLEGLKIGNTKK